MTMQQATEINYKNLLDKWLEAAERGDASAQYNLAVSFHNGQGVKQDYKKAAEWYLKAAEQGKSKAQFCLGFLYQNGKGVIQDYSSACCWYLKAAEQGNVDAQCFLGTLYYYGKGIAKDEAKAVLWLTKASEQGDNRAKDILSKILVVKDENQDNIKSNSSFHKEKNYVTNKSKDWITLSIILLALATFSLAGVMFFKTGDKVKTSSVKYALNIPEDKNSRHNELFVDSGMDYAKLTDIVLSSIVSINTDIAMGSGFFVSNKGDVLTNYHVIDGAKEIIVTPYDKEPFYALVKDIDPEQDMALIVMKEAEDTPFLKISDTLPRQGEAIMAVGNPRGLDRTVSNGIVSALRDNNKWIQFTAPVSPGSSGGALINKHGEVVGMPTKLKIDGQNLNFAIASPVLKRFFEMAKHKSPRAMPKIVSRKPKETVFPESNPNLVFVKKDSEYEIYLDTEYIKHYENSSIVSFITAWYPSDIMKQKIAKDKNFNLIAGKELGVFLLIYVVDLNNNSYVHLRTINFYTDGDVARDYIKPHSKIKWNYAKDGSRISALISMLRSTLSHQKNF